MCAGCSEPSAPYTLQPLTRAQDEVLSWIKGVWNGVVVYDVSNAAVDQVLIVGHKGSKYHFSLVEADGRRQVVTDPHNQQSWLEGITSGQYPLHVEPLEVALAR
jgi:hypothetical protein